MTTLPRPKATSGMRHIALTVQHLENCLYFYQELMGMAIEWQPDPKNIYLTSGNDNLALHQAPETFDPSAHQRLDHLGFILDQESLVNDWYQFLKSHNVPMKTAPKTHRDGARSFYCFDPDGNTVQVIYHPPLAKETTNA